MVNKTINNIVDSLKSILNNILADKSLLLTFIIVFAILIATTVFIYIKFIKPMLNIDHVLNKEFRNKKDKDSDNVLIILFYTEWCPYCKKAMPEWDKFEKYVNNLNNSNNYSIVLSKIDCDKKPEVAEKYNIEGYPTIKLLYKGKTYDYDAKPNKDNLITFLESSIN
tara:strand:- start:2493 stop:2993 length:501 start_codon:yes stop_codon:yes gene_type:complete